MRAPSGPTAGARTRRRGRSLLASVPLDAERPDEPLHRAARDRDLRGELAVRSARVVQVAVVVRAVADAGARRIGEAHLRATLRRHRDAVRARERAEVLIERPVLLHHEDQVIEVHDAGRGVERAERIGDRLRRGRVEQRSAVDAERGSLGRDREPVGHEERQRDRARPRIRTGSARAGVGDDWACERASGGSAREPTHAAATRPATTTAAAVRARRGERPMERPTGWGSIGRW